MALSHGIPGLVPHISAQEILIGQRLLAAAADTQLSHAAIARKKRIVYRTVPQMPVQHQRLIDLVYTSLWASIFSLPVERKLRFHFAGSLITADAYFLTYGYQVLNGRSVGTCTK